MTKEIKDLIKTVESQGWTVERARNNHYKFRGPRGELVVVGNSISDHRGLKNARAYLQRAGVQF